MGLGPFDLTGGAFLVLFVMVTGLALAASRLLDRYLRPQGRPGRIANEDELAALAGGNARLAEAATIRLLASGALVQQGANSFMTIDHNAGSGPVERTIIGICTPAKWKTIKATVEYRYWEIADRLIDAGLMLEKSEHRRLRAITSVPLLLAMGFGAIKLLIGLSRDRPVFILALLLIVVGLLAMVNLWSSSPLTVEGRALLSREAAQCERLRRAPMEDEMGKSVALFGTAVLAGSAYADFHTMRDKRDNSGGDSGGGCGGDSGSDGGCGGGGCGGCGGCGG